jgi:hypothetical protein
MAKAAKGKSGKPHAKKASPGKNVAKKAARAGKAPGKKAAGKGKAGPLKAAAKVAPQVATKARAKGAVIQPVKPPMPIAHRPHALVAKSAVVTVSRPTARPQPVMVPAPPPRPKKIIAPEPEPLGPPVLPTPLASYSF